MGHAEKKCCVGVSFVVRNWCAIGSGLRMHGIFIQIPKTYSEHRGEPSARHRVQRQHERMACVLRLLHRINVKTPGSQVLALQSTSVPSSSAVNLLSRLPTTASDRQTTNRLQRKSPTTTKQIHEAMRDRQHGR